MRSRFQGKRNSPTCFLEVRVKEHNKACPNLQPANNNSSSPCDLLHLCQGNLTFPHFLSQYGNQTSCFREAYSSLFSFCMNFYLSNFSNSPPSVGLPKYNTHNTILFVCPCCLKTPISYGPYQSIPEDMVATELFKGFVQAGGTHAYNHLKRSTIGYLGSRHPCFSSELSEFFKSKCLG